MTRKKRPRQVLMLLIAVTWLGLNGTVTSVHNQDLVCCDQWIKSDGAWFGARRDCKKALEELSPASRAKACEQYKKLNNRPWFRPFVESPTQIGCCLEAGEVCGAIPAKCNPEKQTADTKCEPPPPESNNPPWFNSDSSCPDRQKATISWSQRPPSMDVSFTVAICGQVIRYIYPGGGSLEKNPPPGVRSFEVCCDSWRKAAETKSPCDARLDFDCDGTPNSSDQMPDYAFRDRRPDDFLTNSPLSSLPFWKSLYQPSQSGCKDCKWELVRVDYTCKEEYDAVASARQHRSVFDAKYDYQATWKCPATGQSQVQKETVTKDGLRCPTPPKRSWP
ncbi:MAG: hypothetical protein AABM67_03575 [Acidobacteriota bacterium]